MKIEQSQEGAIWYSRAFSLYLKISQEQPVLIVGWELTLSITFSVPSSKPPSVCQQEREKTNEKWKGEATRI